MKKPRKGRGPNRLSTKTKLAEYLEVCLEMHQALLLAGYANGGKRELPRITGTKEQVTFARVMAILGGR